ncbi:hypothetical protein TCAL_03370 [Tigriopus californicus]|uniref:Cuticle protein 6 n=2 Tax=Tigriopus californicus TaxID=6832 RepID=A0A553P5L9_TIGCA|nr:hypothetical protein TCAL_03370 [Tigriopus californicus]|eukprot:TCALIF_03370-PA protein Name:"Similar to Endocuticle structural glycoprotein ABD-4 (Locusta migratoria)" AED:0.00 eAED:0.00 QI:83/1/1/1/1/1/2/298/242
MAFKYVLLACMIASVGLCAPQQGFRSNNFGSPFNLDFTLNERAESTTPVPILKLVDRQNPDGSYTYGYESGDGSYKLETRYTSGDVQGKYGYYDPTGQLREVEYGATPERGFEPKADGLVVAPPTLAQDIEADYSYEDEQQLVEKDLPEEPKSANARQFANFAPRANPNKRVVVRRRPVGAVAKPRARTSSILRPTPVPQAAPVRAPFQPRSFNSVDSNQFIGHPAKNINLQTGSFSFEYSG